MKLACERCDWATERETADELYDEGSLSHID